MPDASLASMGLRLAISMGVVIGLMMLAARLLRRAQAYAAGSAKTAGRRQGKVTRVPIAISSIAPLNRTASVAIVRAAGRELVLGITEQQVTLLHSAIETRDAVETIDADLDGRDDLQAALNAELDRPALDGAGDSDDPFAGLIDLDDLASLTGHDAAATTDPHGVTSPSAARIAALAPTSSREAGSDGGSSAWTEALETLRARTVRR